MRTYVLKRDEEAFAIHHWDESEFSHSAVSVETLDSPIDKYDIINFAHDDYPRFMELVQHLSPRDQELVICFALLQKRLTDLSILVGKAGHRAEEDLHKACHKLAGLAAFGPEPKIETLESMLHRNRLEAFGEIHSFAACLWKYATCRDFTEVSRTIGRRGLRRHMLRAFKTLHAAEGREEGLLAGWILWLVDGSDPKGKGWRKRKASNVEYKLGPTVFRSQNDELQQLESARPASQRGGRRHRTKNVKIQRRMKFMLRGMNAR